MHIALSPCAGICRLDEATGYCVGCGRTGDEIAAWATAGAGGRRAVWSALPARLQSLGVGFRRLPWSPADVRGFVTRTLREAGGSWLVTAPGACTSFGGEADAGCEVRHHGSIVEAFTAAAALRLNCGGDARAFAVDGGAGGNTDGVERIVVAVQKPPPRGLGAPAGAGHPLDRGAIRSGDRAQPLLLIDADEDGARWGIRIGDPALAAALGGRAGPSVARVLALADALADAGAVVVIETALARIEVPIARARLEEGAFSDVELPETFISAAVFQPRQ